MSEKKSLKSVRSIEFYEIPYSGHLLGKSDGNYGYVTKGDQVKPIKHSMIRDVLITRHHKDFIYFDCEK